MCTKDEPWLIDSALTSEVWRSPFSPERKSSAFCPFMQLWNSCFLENIPLYSCNPQGIADPYKPWLIQTCIRSGCTALRIRKGFEHIANIVCDLWV